MLSRRSIVRGTGASLAAALIHRASWAQGGAPLRLIVGYPAGGNADFVARVMADYLRAALDQTVIVENRAGAGSRIAADYVRTAAPDGNTLLFGPNLLFTIYPHVYRQIRYDLKRDFAPIASIFDSAYSVSIGPAVPAEVKTLVQYAAWARAEPRRAVFASPAPGGTPHFLGMMLAREIGVDLMHVPYKGGAPMAQDLLGGQIPMAMQVMGDAANYVRSGRLRSLGVSGSKRSPFLPDVPTLVESGHPSLVAIDPMSIFAPSKTPPEAVERLEKAIGKTLLNPAFQKRLNDAFLEPSSVSGAALVAQLERDARRWGPVIHASGFKAEE